MSYRFVWILLLVYTCAPALAHPVQGQDERKHQRDSFYKDDSTYYDETTTESDNEKVISVRITSSIAVGRSQKKMNGSDDSDEVSNKQEFPSENSKSNKQFSSSLESQFDDEETYNIPGQLNGANIEFIKQLKAKKGTRDRNVDHVHPFELLNNDEHYYEHEPVVNDRNYKIDENIDDIPLARKIPSSYALNNLNNIRKSMNNNTIEPEDSLIEKRNETVRSDLFEKAEENFSQNNFTSLFSLNMQDIIDNNSTQNENSYNQTEDTLAEPSLQSTVKIDQNKEETQDTSISELKYFQSESAGKNAARLTTVSFNIVHDAPQNVLNNNRLINNREQQVVLGLPRVYSEPARVYSEPAKFYSEPAKIYSEPAKIYSEPAKIYSEPSKIYSEPAKFYSPPASLHISPSVPPNLSTWQHSSYSATPVPTAINTTPLSPVSSSQGLSNVQRFNEHQPEKNYEVDEKTSLMTNGRSHGVQETTTEKCKQDNCKVGYVVEGRQFKKYRVEERTSDGFIVGEYGVVRNEDGALRGVRYTADSEASPRLIYDALMKFLQLR